MRRDRGLEVLVRSHPVAGGQRCRVTAGPLTRPLARAMSRKLRTGNYENVRRFAALAESAVARRDV